MTKFWTGILSAATLGLVSAACGSAQIIQRTQTGGTIALSGSHEKAMPKAQQMMSQHCGGPYTVVREGFEVVGSETVHSQETEVGEDGVERNRGVQSTNAKTEWRVYYQCGNIPVCTDVVPPNATPAPPNAPADDAPPTEPPPGPAYGAP